MGTADVSAAQLAKEIRRAESAFRFLSEYGVYVSGKRVVDVGSGAGGALVVAKLFGAKTVLGVDTDARSWAIPETFGIRVMNRLPVERNWDLVVCSHLIEHVLRPVEVLRTLGLYLASGGYGNPPGYLYVETPAWGPKAEVKLPHPYMYSEKSFRLLAKRAGLSVVAMTDGIQAMLRRAT